jgi:hypothetical protein
MVLPIVDNATEANRLQQQLEQKQKNTSTGTRKTFKAYRQISRMLFYLTLCNRVTRTGIDYR